MKGRYALSSCYLTTKVLTCRLRLSVNPGRANEVRVGVEILPIVAGLSMIQVGCA